MASVLRYGLILLMVTVLSGWLPLSAQTDAMNETARHIWMEKNPHSSGDTGFRFDRITGQGELMVYERFNPASFIILKMTQEGYALAGYSTKNLFFGHASGQTDTSAQPELLDALTKDESLDSGKLKGSTTLIKSIGPLIQSQWGQGEFYNYYCPRDSRGPNGRVYVGCVAVAVGQILRYYGVFNSINFQYSFDSGYYGNLNAQVGPYNWTAMDNNPIAVNLETSDFLSDLGILLQMNYGPSGSSTNSHRTLEALHELGYTDGIILRKSKFTAESWAEVFYQNLSEYKPVLVTGGGHAFVCDGYSEDGLFHFNLGWDGYGDGYYPLSSVMTLPVNEVFTDLQPVSWPNPPVTIGLKISGYESFVTWHYDSGQQPLLSRVYVDDKIFMETTDTILSSKMMEPGIHLVTVSSVDQDGESRWIGPVEVFARGSLLTVEDPLLYSIFQKSLGYSPSDTQVLQLFEGDLSRITSLEINQPVKSLDGLEWCNHLKRLVIKSYPGIELDAGPLEKLPQLRILEWNGRPMLHPEAIGKLSELWELRIRQTRIESLDFLASINHLMKFEFSGAPIGHPGSLPEMPLLCELVLNNTGLTNAEFISGMTELISLDLSDNQITETGFLSTLSQLNRADLSGNHITKLLLTDKLQSLKGLDVSRNDIAHIAITSELTSLETLDLSHNKLLTPERLLLYTPALVELDLSNNQLRNMGKQRCQQLEDLDVSGNDLIATDWVSLQPSLKSLNLEHNRISDLSGLVRNDLFRQIHFLGLDQNPLSKESFQEWLPTLIDEIDSLSKPGQYQPFSPCYLTPSNGSRQTGSGIEMQWVADDPNQKCVYDLYMVQGDSLVPVLSGLQSCKGVLDQKPANAFSWVVAARTADTVFYSGVYDVVSTAALSLPFDEGFEPYHDGEPLSLNSDIWLVTDDNQEADSSAFVTSSTSQSGYNSLKITDNGTATLSIKHLDLPYISVKFSALIPAGQHGMFRVENMNGMYLRLVWDASNTGRLYVNDLLYRTFVVDHQKWTDYEIMAHARNNNLYVKAGEQVIMNNIWMVPEKVICTESIAFSSQKDEGEYGNPDNVIYIDDIKITSKVSTSADYTELQTPAAISVYPNPCTDYVTVTFAESGTNYLSIIDMTGRVVYRQMIDAEANSVNVIPLPGLTAGVYTLYTGNRNIKPVRIVRSQSPD